jgi:hypothetical protein
MSAPESLEDKSVTLPGNIGGDRMMDFRRLERGGRQVRTVRG